MQIKAVRGALGEYGNVRRGQIVDLPDTRAQQLVKRGLFVPVQGKEAAKSATARPSPQETPRTGGHTGGETTLSSSRAARAPKTLSSTKSKDDAG